MSHGPLESGVRLSEQEYQRKGFSKVSCLELAPLPDTDGPRLLDAGTYDQSQLDGPPQAPFTRGRTNSNDSAPPMGAEPGPLARIPSPDPDHIDGLHRSDSASIRHSTSHQRSLSISSSASRPDGMLPPLSFDADTSSLGSFLSSGSTAKERPNSVYSNAEFNASAPALGTHNSEQTSLQPDRAHGTVPHVLRSATAPLARTKRLTYAPNLSVYHTFSPIMYDRRSEPATCNRLTPALAQRIKEELNSYKMEEMEVHPASRQQYVLSCLDHEIPILLTISPPWRAVPTSLFDRHASLTLTTHKRPSDDCVISRIRTPNFSQGLSDTT